MHFSIVSYFHECLPFFCRDLSKINGLKNIIIESFNHNSEEVKSAASYALGNISLGNLGDYVPFVLKEIEAQPKRQYLLLHSLKEVRFYHSLSKYLRIFDMHEFISFQIISAQSGSAKSVQVLTPFVPAIWRQLFNHCECSEEGTKSTFSFFKGQLVVYNLMT